MAATIPIMCAAALHLIYSGEITSLTQIETGLLKAFPKEVPNYGFVLRSRPELWEMVVTLRNDESSFAAGGTLWFKDSGTPRWRKSKKILVQIAACEDDGMLAALQGWGAFAPPMR